MYKRKIERLKDKVLDGYLLDKEEALFLINLEDEYLEYILSMSKAIKDKYIGKRMSLCNIISGSVGKCSEDCKFCAQSAHYSTAIEEKEIPSYKEFEKRAKENENFGIRRYSLVSSGKGVDKNQLEIILEYYNRIRKEVDIELCASLGILSYEDMIRLKEAGVTRYHHNIETSRKNFKNICSTHSYDERIETIKNAQRVGLKICSGGIIGMGENLEDRIDFIMELRSLNIDSIPVNILDPIKGTPLENQKQLSEKEILKTLSVFRIVYPKAELRYAGGRRIVGKSQVKGIESAIDGMISGNFLTTIGSSIEEDLEMVKGYEIV